MLSLAKNHNINLFSISNKVLTTSLTLNMSCEVEAYVDGMLSVLFFFFYYTEHLLSSTLNSFFINIRIYFV